MKNTRFFLMTALVTLCCFSPAGGVEPPQVITPPDLPGQYLLEIPYIEIAPEPISGAVAVPEVVVRGRYVAGDNTQFQLIIKDAATNDVLATIEPPDLVLYSLSPNPLLQVNTQSNYFYTEAVPITGYGSNVKAVFQNWQTSTGSWNDLLTSTAFIYNAGAASATKWGRIANTGDEGKPLKGACFYGGPFNQPGEKYGYEMLSTRPHFDYWKWRSQGDLDTIMGEIQAAGVNTIKVSWWGDEFDEVSETSLFQVYNHVKDPLDTLKAFDDEGNLMSIPFNYWLRSAVTYNTSCQYDLKMSARQDLVDTGVLTCAQLQFDGDNYFFEDCSEQCDPKSCNYAIEAFDLNTGVLLVNEKDEACAPNHRRYQLCGTFGIAFGFSTPALYENCETTTSPATSYTCYDLNLHGQATTVKSDFSTPGICINTVGQGVKPLGEPCDSTGATQYPVFPYGVDGTWQEETVLDNDDNPITILVCKPNDRELCNIGEEEVARFKKDESSLTDTVYCYPKCRRWPYYAVRKDDLSICDIITPTGNLGTADCCLDLPGVVEETTRDVYEQVFRAAADRDMYVVPVIVFEHFRFDKEYPQYLDHLANTIARLFEKYPPSSYQNWLKLYNKDGTAYYAINILDAVHRGNNFIDDDPFFYNLPHSDFAYGDPHPDMQFGMALDMLSSKISYLAGVPVGFMIDPSPMGPSLSGDPFYNHTYLDNIVGNERPFHDFYDADYASQGELPAIYYDYNQQEWRSYNEPSFSSRPFLTFSFSPEELLSSESLLAVNPFNVTTDPIRYEIHNGNLVRLAYDFFDVALLRNAYQYYGYWKGTGLPLIATAVPGFNDEQWTRIQPMVYGDIDFWHLQTELMLRMFNTAGMTLDIWNGFSEGYVWATTGPYVVYRANNWYGEQGETPTTYIDARQGDENYHLAQALFWADPANRSISDIDGDGVADRYDKCLPPPGTPSTDLWKYRNPTVTYSAYDELVNGNADAVLDSVEGTGSCIGINCGARYLSNMGRYAQFVRPTVWGPIEAPIFSWSSDHDLDGIPDVCDVAGLQFIDATDGQTKIGDGFVYSTTTSTPRPQGIQEDNMTNVTVNATIDLAHTAIGDTDEETSSIRYCWLEETRILDWGLDGFCTRGEYKENSSCNSNASGYILSDCDPHFLSFGNGHGSDPIPLRGGIPSWKVPEGVNTSDDIPAPPSSQIAFFDWNWIGNLEVEYPTLKQVFIDEAPDIGTWPFAAPPVIPDPFIRYTLSTGVRGTSTDYTLGDAVNPAFFRKANHTASAAETNEYIRSFRESDIGIALNYYTFTMPIFNFVAPIEIHRLNLVKALYTDTLRFYENTCSYCAISNLVDPSRINIWSFDGARLSASERILPNKDVSVFPISGIGYLGIGKTTNNGTMRIYLNMPQHPADWHPIGVIEGNESGFTILDGVQYGRDFIALAANIGQGSTTYHVPRGAALYSVVKDTTTSLTYRFEKYADLPTGSERLKPVVLGSTLYLIGSGNEIVLYRMSANNVFEEVSLSLKPAARVFYTVVVRNNALYLAGGGSVENDVVTEQKDLWRYDETNGWQEIAGNINIFMFRPLIAFDGDDIVLTEQLTFGGTEISGVRIAPDGSVTEEEYPVEGLPFTEKDFCLNETDELLKAGTLNAGTCQPFTHPWYKQYSIGTTVYSVAGKGNRLYVGTSTAIKVYDISDPNALVLKSTFTTNKTVYDLEVADGDIMYAATSKGLYKLNTANPDTLTIIGSFYSTGSYNYQYRIQLYNDLLYVGDDNGINIRSTTNFARLSYVNIGSTMDFAIANGELAMYWDDFWSSGIDIRDAATLSRKAWDYPYCSTGELTTDHGAFYLSCDGYEYRFVGLPNTYLDYTELNGDMREMQENYLYNGWVYIPDGNKVKLSTNNEVPSVCGNGIIEPGEFCDGNSEDCAMVDPTQWDSGTAICNSTCTAWDTGDCYQSGC